MKLTGTYILLLKTIKSKLKMLNTTETLLFKALVDSDTSVDEFVSVNDVLKEYNDMKKQ